MPHTAVPYINRNQRAGQPPDGTTPTQGPEFQRGGGEQDTAVPPSGIYMNNTVPQVILQAIVVICCFK